MDKRANIIRCERCNEILNPAAVVWLELSQTNGRYYVTLPKGHVSQGSFPFGRTCAKSQTAGGDLIKRFSNEEE